jgi:hypothetical protein
MESWSLYYFTLAASILWVVFRFLSSHLDYKDNGRIGVKLLAAGTITACKFSAIAAITSAAVMLVLVAFSFLGGLSAESLHVVKVALTALKNAIADVSDATETATFIIALLGLLLFGVLPVLQEAAVRSAQESTGLQSILVRCLHLIASRGAIDTAKSIAKPAKLLLTVLALLSAIAPTANAPGGIGIPNAIVTIGDFAILADSEKAQKAWKDYRGRPPAQRRSDQPVPDDVDVAAATARAFELWIADAFGSQAGPPVQIVGAMLRQHRIAEGRRRVLELVAETARSSQTEFVVDHGGTADVRGGASASRHTAIGTPLAPRTVIGAEFQLQLQEQINHSDPTQARQVRQWLWASTQQWLDAKRTAFNTPLSIKEIEAELVSHVIGNLIDPIKKPIGNAAGEYGVLAQELTKRAGGKALTEGASRIYETAKAQVLTRIWAASTDGLFPEVLPEAKLSESVAFSKARTTILDHAARKTILPAINERVQPERVIALQRFANDVAKVASDQKRTAAFAAVMDANRTYDDTFPWHDSPSSGGGGFPSSAEKAKTTVDARRGPALRARSSIRLARFAGARGVIIGTLPADSSEAEDSGEVAPQIVDLLWEPSNEGWRVVFVAKNGELIATPPTRPEHMLAALSYAADGRKIAVTMVPVYDNLPLKIIVNPALVDTDVGRHAIHLDQFIDTFIHDTPVRQQINRHLEEAQTWVIVYQHAVITAKQLSKAIIAKTKLSLTSGEIDSLALEVGAAELAKVALDAMPSALANLPTDHKAIAILDQKDSFDPARVAAIKECKPEGQSPSRQNLLTCLFERLPLSRWVREEFEKPEPTSFVLEHGYKLDERFADAMAPLAVPTTALMPFQFRYQIPFSTDDDNDREPYILSDFDAAIATQVGDRIGRDPAAAETIAVMRRFAVLQRIFRAAFEDRLGNEFPHDKLVLLARDIADATRETYRGCRTARWLVSADQGLAMMSSAAQLEAEAAVGNDKQKLAQAAHYREILKLWEIIGVSEESRLIERASGDINRCL